MKKQLSLYLCILAGILLGISANASELSTKLKGKILLQVEQNGESWYVNPADEKRYFMGRPDDAFALMRKLGVGITNKDLNKIAINFEGLGASDNDLDGLHNFIEDSYGTDKNKKDTDGDGYNDGDEVKGGYNPLGAGKLNIDNVFAAKQIGKILLQVEGSGEAWYVNPANKQRYYLGRPMDAFNVMRRLGLGISNNNLNAITISEENLTTSVAKNAIEEYCSAFDKNYYNTCISDCESKSEKYKSSKSISSRLNLSIEGSATILVTGPDGKKNGVSPDLKIVQDNSDVKIYRDANGMLVSFTNPMVGDYQIEATWTLIDRKEISLSYLAGNDKGEPIAGDEREIPLFLNSAPVTFKVRIDPSLCESMALKMPVYPPHDFKVVNVDDKAVLIWSYSDPSKVKSYNIYSKDETDAFFTLLTSIPGSITSYQTKHPIKNPRKLYIMSTIDNQGNESMLTETIDNTENVAIKYLDGDIAITPPENFKAIDVNGETILVWNEPSDSIAESFNIYSRKETDASFTLLKTIPGQTYSYRTTHPFGTPKRFYVISSVDSANKESIRTEIISNN